jgi:hypothetical protein
MRVTGNAPAAASAAVSYATCDGRKLLLSHSKNDLGCSCLMVFGTAVHR